MTQTPPAVPNPPVGVPAWLTRIVAALLLFVGPAVVWIDPENRIPTGAWQAIIILGFLGVGAVIGAIHLIHSDVHEYGWTMNAVNHIEADAEAEIKQVWPEMKQAFDAAQPALDQIGAFKTALETARADINQLQERAAASGLNPQAVLQALRDAGMTFPAGPAVAVSSAPAPAAGAPADPAATAQAS